MSIVWERGKKSAIERWNIWAEDPKRLLADLDALRRNENLPSLLDLTIAGTAIETWTIEGSDPMSKFVVWFDAGEDLKYWSLLPPCKDSPDFSPAIQWQPPEDYLQFLSLCDGLEPTNISKFTPHWKEDRAEIKAGNNTFFNGVEESFLSNEMLYGEDFLADIHEDPEEYDFTPEQLTLNQPGDMLAVYDDSNSNFGVFHRLLKGPDDEPGFILWFHDEPGGLYSEHMVVVDRYTFGDFLTATLYGHVKDEDSFRLIFGNN